MRRSAAPAFRRRSPPQSRSLLRPSRWSSGRSVTCLAIAAVAVAAGCAVLALAPAAIARRDRSVMRVRADRLLRKGVRVHSASALLTWREAELTSERKRKALARSLRHVVRELEGGVLPGAVPLNRFAARPHVDLIRALSERLAALERPVTAQGMLLARRLRHRRLRQPALRTRARRESSESSSSAAWPRSRPRCSTRRMGACAMFDLAAIAIAAACFIFIFVVRWALERI